MESEGVRLIQVLMRLSLQKNNKKVNEVSLLAIRSWGLNWDVIIRKGFGCKET